MAYDESSEKSLIGPFPDINQFDPFPPRHPGRNTRLPIPTSIMPYMDKLAVSKIIQKLPRQLEELNTAYTDGDAAKVEKIYKSMSGSIKNMTRILKKYNIVEVDKNYKPKHV